MIMSSALSLFLLLHQNTWLADSQVTAEHYCKRPPPSSCGRETPIIIKPPFRLSTDCWDANISLSCENNATVLYLSSARYYVKAINYDDLTIRLVADGVVNGNCSSLPISQYSTSPDVPLFECGPEYKPLTQPLALISCDNPVVVVRSAAATPPPPVLYVDASHCVDFGPNSRSYAVLDRDAPVLWFSRGVARLSDLPETCTLEMVAALPITYDNNNVNVTFQEIHRQLEYGFQLSWRLPQDVFVGRYVKFRPIYYNDVILYRLVLLVLGTPVVVALLVYKWRRRHRSAYHSIEEFLQNQTNLVPVRYSYSHIKKITRGFKDKLGQGGFGSVYKAKLRSGSLAAVKILANKQPSPAAAGRKGEDFMNEVATIGRIHHANVVRLIGYCCQGSKQALVYEFMPNGSLDKHISRHKDNGTSASDQCSTTSCLSLEQLYKISLGVARGIEYLHRGCAMQILHFDIKPHNILLDEDFTPKVSDFGLARLNQAGRDNNIATLTAARGTIGYMAPELFYKNIGGVSYKADVYSFGMLLLEMVGKRRSLNATETDQSTAYFPSWVHNQVSMTPEAPIAVGEVTEEEEKVARKMVIVGLWCIQMSPQNRPPMNKVVEMLEGDLESLELPPKPVLYAREAVRTNEEGSSSSFVSYDEYTQSVISNQCDD